MKAYLGVTDPQWFAYLSRTQPEDINFWQPRAGVFKALQPGEPFVFKLRKPYNHVAGLGFFAGHSMLPLSMAWDIFGDKNGCDSLETFRGMIQGIRRDRDPDPVIGCIVLSQPIFFKPEDWLPAPPDWKSNIVQGKSYDLGTLAGRALWEQLDLRMKRYQLQEEAPIALLAQEEAPAYRTGLGKIRLGQAAFRVSILEAYQRRCAMTGERTLPVLEAAHIKDYAASGPHQPQNGLLLRSDLHRLFDRGYLTVTPDHHIEVSARIKEQFENGKEYYKLRGQKLLVLPGSPEYQPDKAYLDWHNVNRYRG